MSTDNFRDVGEFHARFGLPNANGGNIKPRVLDEDLLQFRTKFMYEELNEFEDAATGGSLEGMADALVDLVYVAMGTAHLMGLPWEELWNEVQRANMTKVRAARAEDSKRGSTYDVVKPEGWTPPDIAGVLARHMA